MTGCLLVGLVAVALAEPRFTLRWEHSVEHVAWQEDWEIGADTLTLATARVKGSGAGMEPGDDAILQDGWWVWHPGWQVEQLTLAASGTTTDGWQLCSGGACQTIGSEPGPPIPLAPCP